MDKVKFLKEVEIETLTLTGEVRGAALDNLNRISTVSLPASGWIETSNGYS
jgi:hypothetical protein